MKEGSDGTLLEIIGWGYFFAWSVSFYGMIWVNWKLKSVEGLNFDFLSLNFTGFFFYFIYNIYGYFIDSKITGQVDLNDLLFSLHALFATTIIVIQAFYYPYQNNKIHKPTIIFLSVAWTFIPLYLVIQKVFHISVSPSLHYIKFLGYFKLVITLLKYIPQVLWNYWRQSTEGWSIFNVVADLVGGVLSFTQMGLEVILIGAKVNWTKIFLGFISIFFDVIFVVQHYCLYGGEEGQEETDSDWY